MTVSTRIKINLASREFEVEGSEAFVKDYSDKIDNLLGRLFLDGRPASSERSQNNVGDRLSSVDPQLPESFGEYFYTVPKDANANDQILVAGHFAQLSSDDNSFSTQAASALLLEQSVKLANPSEAIKRNLSAKRLIKLSKGKYRVSRDGLDHIAALRAA